MKLIQFIRKGFFALLVGATTLVACSKDSDSPEVPKGNYGVFIGGVELTYENYQNINSTNFPALKSGKVSYDPINRVLTLDGATINATGIGVPAINQPKGTTATLTIVLKNKSTLSSEKDRGIYVEEATLRITGNGSLTINPNRDETSIYVVRELTIEGGCFIDANREICVKRLLSTKPKYT